MVGEGLYDIGIGNGFGGGLEYAGESGRCPFFGIVGEQLFRNDDATGGSRCLIRPIIEEGGVPVKEPAIPAIKYVQIIGIVDPYPQKVIDENGRSRSDIYKWLRGCGGRRDRSGS